MLRTASHPLWMSLVLTLALGGSFSRVSGQGSGLTISKGESVVTVQVDGKPFAEYVFQDPKANKTYLWPVYGPTGHAMTRAYPMKDVPGEVTDHPHHRGIWFGHQDVGGYNTWAEQKSFIRDGKPNPKNLEAASKLGTEKLKAFRSLSANDKEAVIVCELDYIGGDGQKKVSEVRTMKFHRTADYRFIDIDQEFFATEGDVTFGDEKDAGLSIRVPSTMSVDSKQGGTIVTSEGLTDKEAWGKRATWVDYSGPAESRTMGVVILNHPSSFRHPTTWHVRTYGLFTANPFGTLDPAQPNGPHTLKKGEKMNLRHRFVFHDGRLEKETFDQLFKDYAAGR